MASNHFEIDSLIKRLIIKVNKLETELQFYKNIEHVLMKENTGLLTFTQSNSSLITLDKINDVDLAFVTITFDPHRFDKLELSTEQSQKDYILTMLSKASKRPETYTEFIYGCFEKHKSGVIHTHLLYKIDDKNELEKYLLRKFASKPRNKHAVDISWVKDIEKVYEYINGGGKDKYGYYLLDRTQDFEKINL